MLTADSRSSNGGASPPCLLAAAGCDTANWEALQAAEQQLVASLNLANASTSSGGAGRRQLAETVNSSALASALGAGPFPGCGAAVMISCTAQGTSCVAVTNLPAHLRSLPGVNGSSRAGLNFGTGLDAMTASMSLLTAPPGWRPLGAVLASSLEVSTDPATAATRSATFQLVCRGLGVVVVANMLAAALKGPVSAATTGAFPCNL